MEIIATTGSEPQTSCSRMKILFVTYGWSESGGGTQFPNSVARELVKRGYDVTVFYASLLTDSSRPSYFVRKECEGDIRLFAVINRPALFTDSNNPQREINDPHILNAFSQVLNEVHPDLVHFHNFHGLTFSIAEEVRRRGIPSCYTPHNFHMIDPELYLLKSGLIRWEGVDPLVESDAVVRNPHLREWYGKRVETTRRVLNEWIELTCCVSRRQKELLVRYGADANRMAILHQASPITDALWEEQNIPASKRRSCQQALKIGYIGGVLPIKGVQILVSAAQAFTREDVRIRVYGFADPDYQILLQSSDVNGIVTFCGPYQPQDLARIAGEIDVAVLSTLVEDCAPLTLLELHAMRLPVIASRIGGIPDFIADGVDGFLYDPYDIKKLTALIRRCIDEPGLLEKLRNNLAVPSHTFSRYLDQLERIYAALLTGQILDADKFSLLVQPRSPLDSVDTLTVSWHGGLFVNHSLAHVNRELFLQLLDHGFDLSFTPTEPDNFEPSVDPRFNRLENIRNRSMDNPQVTIRHQWPPDFTPAASGKLFLIQPWEFGSVPKEWVERINADIDELWVPTHFVRHCYLESGVRAEKVYVVPNGVDTERFNPEAAPLPLKTRKRFRFLFVGGTIHRKGIDILLGAYHQAFSANDDVCLVIKDMGGASFYQGQTAGEMIARFRSDPAAPEIEYIESDLSTAEMVGLYTACHCLVHPYRGEGFGLPIAEAMACGLAPIVTGYGAALDFCNGENAWLVPATVNKLPVKRVGNRETVDYPWLAEPDFETLASLMRHAVSCPDEARQKGDAACRHIRAHFTWERAGQVAAERLRALAGLPQVKREAAMPVADERSEQRQIVANEACTKASVMFQRGDIVGAVQTLLSQGIQMDPESPPPYLELAEILMAANRHDESLQVLPEMPAATDSLLKYEIEALCHCALGDDNKARSAALKASERPRALTVLGTLAARRGDVAEAEKQFRRAIDADPSCGSAWLSLGMLLWGQGKQADAWTAVKRSVTVDPLNREAVRIMRDMAGRLDAE